MNISNMMDKVRMSGLVDIENSSFTANLFNGLKNIYFYDREMALVLKIYSDKRGYYDNEILNLLSGYIRKNIISPIGLFENDPQTATLTPYVAHRAICVNDILKNDLFSQLGNVIKSLNSIPAGKDEGCFRHNAVDFHVIEGFSIHNLNLNDEYKCYVSRKLPSVIKKMTAVSQHGDFTLTNLGVKENSELLVFDWEDYGRIRYPGFDYAMFLISFFYHQNMHNRVLQSPKILNDVVNKYFGGELYTDLNLTESLFAFLLPFYLMCFLYLKQSHNYGPSIIKRVKSLIDQMCASPDWNMFINKMVLPC